MKKYLFLLLTYLLMCSQTCTQSTSESNPVSVEVSESSICDQDALAGHWKMLKGTGTYTNDAGERVTMPMEKYETCTIYLTFMDDNKYRQIDHFVDGDTMDRVGRYEWLPNGCQFKHGRWSKKLNAYSYQHTTVESIDEALMKVETKAPEGGLLKDFVFKGTFMRMTSPFTYKVNSCPGYSLIGTWKLTKGTNNNGSSQWNTLEGLAKLGTNGLSYRFMDDSNYKILQKQGDAIKVHNCTYEWPGTYNREKLLLRDPGGKLMEAKIVKLDDTTLRIQGNMDGDFIDWTFTKN